jgi:hypothetical protein
LAAAALSRCLSIPWIADFGDPWADVDRRLRPWYAPVTALIERRALRQATAVTFTTSQTAARYAVRLGLALPPSFVLPYGFFRETLAPCQSPGELKVAYLGEAHRADRPLDSLIEGLAVYGAATNASVHLRVVGNHSASFRAAAERVHPRIQATFLPRCAYSTSLEHAAWANLLVILGNRSGLQVPGKVYSYAGLPRPILYLHQRAPREDPGLQLLAGLPGIWFARNEPAEVARAVRALAGDFDSAVRHAQERVAHPRLRAWEADYLSEQLMFILRTAARDPEALRRESAAGPSASRASRAGELEGGEHG